ncbi:MAG: hypothetical protein KGJ88_11880 [Verrucomicrobiota bacterium]|nr:hypothetical protein [Verrucomicrobiota bacterium]
MNTKHNGMAWNNDADKPRNASSSMRFAMVQCETFRCAAYQDGNGQWRDPFNGEVLPKVMEVLADLQYG